MYRAGWEKAEYKIQMQLGGQIYSETVSGITKGGFGVHETGSGWNVTHIASGWNCFTAESESGAVVLAHYLMTEYFHEFNRLKISGTELENYKPLIVKIETDRELAELIRLFGIGKLKKTDRQREIEMNIIS